MARPPLKCTHREKRPKWVENNMKVNFENVIFTDECRATLDGPDGWSRGWYDAQFTPSSEVTMAARWWWNYALGSINIINNEMVGPFRVKDGVKITAETYTAFLKEFLLTRYKKKSLSFRKKLIFMHDNAPSHAARLTLGFLNKLLVKNATITEWPPYSPDLNPIENTWSIIKCKVYVNGKQFSSKDELWNVIKGAAKDISANEISKLTSSMDRRLIAVVANHGAYIKY